MSSCWRKKCFVVYVRFCSHHLLRLFSGLTGFRGCQSDVTTGRTFLLNLCLLLAATEHLMRQVGSLSLTLSLSHTHTDTQTLTHTHTHAQSRWYWWKTASSNSNTHAHAHINTSHTVLHKQGYWYLATLKLKPLFLRNKEILTLHLWKDVVYLLFLFLKLTNSIKKFFAKTSDSFLSFCEIKVCRINM